jgi:hypothetical protein
VIVRRILRKHGYLRSRAANRVGFMTKGEQRCHADLSRNDAVGIRIWNGDSKTESL